MYPFLPFAKTEKRRQHSHKQRKHHYGGGIYAGEAGYEVLHAGLGFGCFLNGAYYPAGGGFAGFARRNRDYAAGFVYAAGYKLIARSNVYGNGFARYCGKVNKAFAFNNGAVKRYPVARQYFVSVAGLCFVRMLNNELSVFFKPYGIGPKVKHLFYGALRTAYGYSLQQLAYPIKQHYHYALAVIAKRYGAYGGNAHKHVFINYIAAEQSFKCVPKYFPADYQICRQQHYRLCCPVQEQYAHKRKHGAYSNKYNILLYIVRAVRMIVPAAATAAAAMVMAAIVVMMMLMPMFMVVTAAAVMFVPVLMLMFVVVAAAAAVFMLMLVLVLCVLTHPFLPPSLNPLLLSGPMFPPEYRLYNR